MYICKSEHIVYNDWERHVTDVEARTQQNVRTVERRATFLKHVSHSKSQGQSIPTQTLPKTVTSIKQHADFVDDDQTTPDQVEPEVIDL